jgi:hypothetical protein
MLGDKERQILARLNDAENALRDARCKAIVNGKNSVASELRIVIIALAAAQDIIKDDLPEYRQDNQ